MINIENLKLIKTNIIKATSAYLRYHAAENEKWDDENKKVAEETIGVLILGGQKMQEIINFYLENNKNTLPPDIPSKDSLDEFIAYFNFLSIELQKQLPEEFHNEKLEKPL